MVKVKVRVRGTCEGGVVHLEAGALIHYLVDSHDNPNPNPNANPSQVYVCVCVCVCD